MNAGFLYLTAIIDWKSRYILSWRLSNSLDGFFCRDALDEALSKGKPEVFNTDQGVQFTSTKFTKMLTNNNIRISMDGRGRALDNVFIERFWRTVKQEEVYLKDYQDGLEAYQSLNKYFCFYNKSRPYSSLDYLSPEAVYRKGNFK
jgi:putative transposase